MICCLSHRFSSRNDYVMDDETIIRCLSYRCSSGNDYVMDAGRISSCKAHTQVFSARGVWQKEPGFHVVVRPYTCKQWRGIRLLKPPPVDGIIDNDTWSIFGYSAEGTPFFEGGGGFCTPTVFECSHFSATSQTKSCHPVSGQILALHN